MKPLCSALCLCTLIFTTTAFSVDKNMRLNLPEANVQMLAAFYQRLSGKAVVLDDPELGRIQVSADAGDAVLTISQGCRFIESALYLKGIDVVPKGENEVAFIRYATIEPPPERRRIIKTH